MFKKYNVSVAIKFFSTFATAIIAILLKTKECLSYRNRQILNYIQGTNTHIYGGLFVCVYTGVWRCLIGVDGDPLLF